MKSDSLGIARGVGRIQSISGLGAWSDEGGGGSMHL